VSTLQRSLHHRNDTWSYKVGLTITVGQLGEELRRHRDERGLSLRDVEGVTGVSAATLSRIERGSRPDLDIVMKLAKWMRVVVQASGADHTRKNSDDEFKRSIEVHLRANKNLSAGLARSIAESFDVVMRVELEKAATKKKH
jgi:transcriptional regulator with XRE-family HTH domain